MFWWGQIVHLGWWWFYCHSSLFWILVVLYFCSLFVSVFSSGCFFLASLSISSSFFLLNVSVPFFFCGYHRDYIILSVSKQVFIVFVWVGGHHLTTLILSFSSSPLSLFSHISVVVYCVTWSFVSKCFVQQLLVVFSYWRKPYFSHFWVLVLQGRVLFAAVFILVWGCHATLLA